MAYDPESSRTMGPAFQPQLDEARLERQHERIRDWMLSMTTWRTLAEIAAALGYPEASVSAQLRHLRKPQFGRYVVTKRRRADARWEYRVEKPQPTGQQALF